MSLLKKHEEYLAVWLNLVTFVPDEQERKISKAV